ncbi:uncharacterized protein LOC119566370 isoform X2 [Chelonia mydas]|nr:uncharacterized protein LOC119566370 isoform X2 [Chelonia mydas]
MDPWGQATPPEETSELDDAVTMGQATPPEEQALLLEPCAPPPRIHAPSPRRLPIRLPTYAPPMRFLEVLQQRRVLVRVLVSLGASLLVAVRTFCTKGSVPNSEKTQNKGKNEGHDAKSQVNETVSSGAAEIVEGLTLLFQLCKTQKISPGEIWKMSAEVTEKLNPQNEAEELHTGASQQLERRDINREYQQQLIDLCDTKIEEKMSGAHDMKIKEEIDSLKQTKTFIQQELQDPTSKSDSVAVTVKATFAAFLLVLTVMAICAFRAVKIKKILNEMEREDAASPEKKSDREREKKKNDLKQKLESLQKMVSGTASVIHTVLELCRLGNVLNNQQIMLVKGLANLVAGGIQRANDEAEVTAAVSEAAKNGAHQLQRKFAELVEGDERKKLKQSLAQMADSYSPLVQSEFRESEFNKEFSAHVDSYGPETFQPSVESCQKLAALLWAL